MQLAGGFSLGTPVYPRSFIPKLLQILFVSTSSALKTSLLRVGWTPVGTPRPRSRSEGAIRATLTRTPSASLLLCARRAVFPSLARIMDEVRYDMRVEPEPSEDVGTYGSTPRNLNTTTVSARFLGAPVSGFPTRRSGFAPRLIRCGFSLANVGDGRRDFLRHSCLPSSASSSNPFAITSHFSEALLKLYFQDIPPPLVRQFAFHNCDPGSIPGKDKPRFSDAKEIAVDQLDYSPPTKANSARLPVGSPSDFRTWESYGFSRGPPVSLPLHCGVAPFSPHFTLIGGTQDPINSRLNLSTQLNCIGSPAEIYLRVLETRRSPVAQSIGAPPIWGAGGSGFESRIGWALTRIDQPIQPIRRKTACKWLKGSANQETVFQRSDYIWTSSLHCTQLVSVVEECRSVSDALCRCAVSLVWLVAGVLAVLCCCSGGASTYDWLRLRGRANRNAYYFGPAPAPRIVLLPPANCQPGYRWWFNRCRKIL
ncbi:hypothetical protein PR048_028124 [Dryococelus australis]|uniref:Uncharacterized protein n=1 Tax=Dryococelus australis TaxID=614101 RepID=A0ABQ9GID5_9NEOP|nr:hypothetical protein PR048_028124 [Dryococelus australis]